MNKATHDVRLRIPLNLHQELKAVADSNERSVNYMIVQAISQMVKETKKTK